MILLLGPSFLFFLVEQDSFDSRPVGFVIFAAVALIMLVLLLLSAVPGIT